jgi:hypothetical protein
MTSPSAIALVVRVERVEAVGVEVVDHLPDAVRAGERHHRSGLPDPRY